MGLIHNERTKLTATYLNGIAIALLAVGALAPLIGYLNTGGGDAATLTLISASCVGVSVFLHWIARRFLGSLRE